MMRWFLPLLLVWGPLHAADVQDHNEGRDSPGYVQMPGWFKESFLNLREDVADAAKDGKGVMLYFYHDGCPYCERFIHVNFAQREISAKTRKKFDVIAIKLWGDREVTDLSGEQV